MRLREVKPDRYLSTTTIWSVLQGKVVAEVTGWIVFVNFKTGRPVDLTKAGEPYEALHARIVEKARLSNERYRAWEEKQPKRKPRL